MGLFFLLEFLADKRKSGAQGVSDEPYRLMEGGEGEVVTEAERADGWEGEVQAWCGSKGLFNGRPTPPSPPPSPGRPRMGVFFKRSQVVRGDLGVVLGAGAGAGATTTCWGLWTSGYEGGGADNALAGAAGGVIIVGVVWTMN